MLNTAILWGLSMNHLLKAVGFWIWGLVAIGLSLSLVSVNYRALLLFNRLGEPAAPVASKLASTQSIPSPGAGVKPAAQQNPNSPASLRPAVSGGRFISRSIAHEMTAAQAALQTGRWEEALAYLDAADEVSHVTQFDKKTIDDFRGFAHIKLNRLKEAQADYTRALATGEYSREEAQKTTHMIFQLSAGTQDYATALNYGKQMQASGTASSEDLGVVAQILYLQMDCRQSAVWVDKAVASARESGATPKENWYQFKLQCASDAADNAAMASALMDLIRLTNKTSYWNTLLRIWRQDERDDHNLLMIYRVMYATHSMSNASDYIEMAQLLGDAKLPGEGLAVVDSAISSGLISDPSYKERAVRLRDSLLARADVDKAELSSGQAEREAAQSPTGDLSVALGQLYYGFGDFQDAIATITDGLRKGAARRAFDAYVYLALSQAAMGNAERAQETLGQLKSVPGVSRRMVDLWQLYADARIGSTAALSTLSDKSIQ
jgi:tetratricopeptide (TPR) repeat protein